MKGHINWKLCMLMLAIISFTSVSYCKQNGKADGDIKQGFFGFPQRKAKVLCDNEDMRLSVWNNKEFLFVQVIIWKDNDNALGRTSDGRKIGDYSTLMLDLDANMKQTAGIDRKYTISPWPSMPGLYYQIIFKLGSSILRGNSHGKGSIRFVNIKDGKKIRIDSYLIPLAEIGKGAYDQIRLCCYAKSPKPDLTVNSTGLNPKKNAAYYYPHHIPLKKYHSYTLIKGFYINTSRFLRGRNTAKKI